MTYEPDRLWAVHPKLAALVRALRTRLGTVPNLLPTARSIDREWIMLAYQWKAEDYPISPGEPDDKDIEQFHYLLDVGREAVLESKLEESEASFRRKQKIVDATAQVLHDHDKAVERLGVFPWKLLERTLRHLDRKGSRTLQAEVQQAIAAHRLREAAIAETVGAAREALEALRYTVAVVRLEVPEQKIDDWQKTIDRLASAVGEPGSPSDLVGQPRRPTP